MNEKVVAAFGQDIDKIIEFLEVQRKQHTVMFDGLTSLISLFGAYREATQGGNDDVAN
jgi:hypothetical protein